MERLTFYIVDVFAEKKYSGNPLAVVRKTRTLSDRDMQQIAKEMNYSETTFIMSDDERDGGYDVRIFTPKTELPFAGHPTLGTAYVIRHEIAKDPVDTIVLNLKAGKIPVTFSSHGEQAGILWMKQLNPTFGQALDSGRVAEILSLDASDLDTRFEVQDVSTGAPSIIVPLKNLDAVKRARISRDRYAEFVKDAWAKAILVFCPETYKPENDLNVRLFADYYGVPEDPATGSANGCLAAYLVRNRYFGKDRVNIRVEQGYEIGRPSLLLLRAEAKGDKIDVQVGGKTVMVARGELV
jgi:trans-2,3-dihydro-3-hydroxyanthranilate isomerase